MKFKITCVETNSQHTHFNVFDPHGANCGLLTFLTKDAEAFIKYSWNGDVDWDGKWQRFIQELVAQYSDGPKVPAPTEPSRDWGGKWHQP